jgi:CheY-like chemotaxis protein
LPVEQPESCRILIVDDITKNIQVLGLMLRNNGHQINVVRLHPEHLPNYAPESVVLGAWMLKTAQEIDRWIDQGVSMNKTVRCMLTDHPGMPPELQEVVNDFAEPTMPTEEIEVGIHDLSEEMILCCSLKTCDGTVVVGEGWDLDWTLIRRIRNFSKTKSLNKTVKVVKKSVPEPIL